MKLTRKLLCSAAISLALGTPVLADGPVRLWCPMTVHKNTHDPNPAVEIHIEVNTSAQQVVQFDVVYTLWNDNKANRNDQYIRRHAWSDPHEKVISWSGTYANNPHKTMLGSLRADPADHLMVYSESQFNDGVMEDYMSTPCWIKQQNPSS